MIDIMKNILLACGSCDQTYNIDATSDSQILYWSTPNWGTSNYPEGCTWTLTLTVCIIKHIFSNNTNSNKFSK